MWRVVSHTSLESSPFDDLYLPIALRKRMESVPNIPYTILFPKINFHLYAKPLILSQVLGCVSYVHIHVQNRRKLDLKALKCVFVGHFPTKKGYKCYHPSSKKFFTTMDVTLVEKSFALSQDLSVGGAFSRR